ncbi:poly(A) binding protein Nab2 [Schizosaccharomyces cryophilus OY26]|uniref:Poly(A) binding protein Nab2 n=1 Tax=Schizosaccharomyces cryophilus (strain OY26 / ATCC MYA-4695 / CBS 11777 / NBRC 106824 / NRRL Y48691) TaxID=653667 RepID=S9VQF2_SCHCR|nr:poly(A) binding protein Nab2 [Schizosaccharomyces cryophilus OY26]EPY50193.1 poly(A) binding protein Nab2 [Schizosaccharomyces cryophilus OY26]
MASILENPENNAKIHQLVESKLADYGWAEEAASLTDFIFVMISNGKDQSQVTEELVDLIGPEFDSNFSQWLFDELREFESSQGAQTTNEEQVSGQNEQPTLAETSNERLPETSAAATADTKEEVGKGNPPQTERVGQKLKSSAVPKQRFNPMAPSFSVTKPIVPPAKRFFKHDEEIPLCKFADKCARADCIFAHPTPAASSGEGMVLSNKMCPAGRDCKNSDCVEGHPSPAFATTLPFKGTIPVVCRYNPCLNPSCRFLHPQKSKNMTWTPSSQSISPASISERKFAVEDSQEHLHVS